MPEMRFCYCCGVHHAENLMRLYRTRAGKRWRCIRSIEAAARSIQERDQFGARQTAANLESARHSANIATRVHFLRMRTP